MILIDFFQKSDGGCPFGLKVFKKIRLSNVPISDFHNPFQITECWRFAETLWKQVPIRI